MKLLWVTAQNTAHQTSIIERQLQAQKLTSYSILKYIANKIDKAVLLQAWSGPEGSRKFKVPKFHDNSTGWW